MKNQKKKGLVVSLLASSVLVFISNAGLVQASESVSKTATDVDEAITNSVSTAPQIVASTASPSTGQVDMSPRDNSLTGAGLTTIPYGAKALAGVFDTVNVAGSGSGTTQNVIVPQYPTDGTNDNRPYDEIRLSGSNNWLSIFSTEYQKLNFSTNFSGRVYINFDKANTDGLAFVIHNDSRKTRSITSAVTSQDGQNLGVYGANQGVRDNILQSYRNPAEKAIQNSIAVEFDMNNNNRVDSNAFDNRLGLSSTNPSHMAYSFPGNTNTYIFRMMVVLGQLCSVSRE